MDAYNIAMDTLNDEIRAAIMKAKDAGVSPQAMWEEAEFSLLDALEDAGLEDKD